MYSLGIKRVTSIQDVKWADLPNRNLVNDMNIFLTMIKRTQFPVWMKFFFFFISTSSARAESIHDKVGVFLSRPLKSQYIMYQQRILLRNTDKVKNRLRYNIKYRNY